VSRRQDVGWLLRDRASIKRGHPSLGKFFVLWEYADAYHALSYSLAVGGDRLARSKGVQMKSEDAAKTRHYAGPIKVMNVREVSAYLRVHTSTIYKLLKHNQIPAFHVGNDWRFNIETIDDWRLAQEKLGS
jgi:excisionase family DNA binding protein